MHVVILAGGFGTRISEESIQKPKPLVTIGGIPILCHIMKIYYHQGFTNFLVAGGYRWEMIEPALDAHLSNEKYLSYKVLNTGLETSTGGRLRQCLEYLGCENVMATYGDGLSDINLSELIKLHYSTNGLVTLTAVRPPARFGRLSLKGNKVSIFGEKSQSEEGWINGGFFVINRNVTDYLIDDSVPFEHYPLSQLAKEGKLSAYLHEGFWHPMDTLREKMDLEKLWELGAPWRNW